MTGLMRKPWKKVEPTPPGMTLQEARRAAMRSVAKYNEYPDFEVGEVMRDALVDLVNVSAAFLDPNVLLAKARDAADEMQVADPQRALAAMRELREAFLDLDELQCRGGTGPADWNRDPAEHPDDYHGDESDVDHWFSEDEPNPGCECGDGNAVLRTKASGELLCAGEAQYRGYAIRPGGGAP